MAEEQDRYPYSHRRYCRHPPHAPHGKVRTGAAGRYILPKPACCAKVASKQKPQPHPRESDWILIRSQVPHVIGLLAIMTKTGQDSLSVSSHTHPSRRQEYVFLVLLTAGGLRHDGRSDLTDPWPRIPRNRAQPSQRLANGVARGLGSAVIAIALPLPGPGPRVGLAANVAVTRRLARHGCRIATPVAMTASSRVLPIPSFPRARGQPGVPRSVSGAP